MHRETLYHCTFASSRSRRSAFIAAWDAETAEALFREVLAEESPAEGGIIEVQGRGRIQRRSPFSPATPRQQRARLEEDA